MVCILIAPRATLMESARAFCDRHPVFHLGVKTLRLARFPEKQFPPRHSNLGWAFLNYSNFMDNIKNTFRIRRNFVKRKLGSFENGDIST